MLLTAAFIINSIAGLTFVLVGMALLVLRPRRPGAMYFGTYAVVSGAQQLLGNLGSAFAEASFLLALSYPFWVVTPIALVAAASYYAGSKSAWWQAPFIAVGGLGVVLILADPRLIIGDSARLTQTGLFLWTMPPFIAIALATVFIVGHHTRSGTEELRREGLLLILALAPYLAYTATFGILLIAYSPLPIYTPFVDAGYSITFGLALLAMTWVVGSLWSTRAGDSRLLAGAIVGSAAAGAIQISLTQEFALFGGILRILAALLLGYGLLKYGLFGIDLKIKNTLRQGTILAVFTSVFFLVDQLAQYFVSAMFGAFAGLIAALLLFVVLAPVRKIARRVADRVMPHVHDTTEYATKRRSTVYRAAAAAFARDGIITAKERELLDALKAELGLPHEEAAAMEREVLAAAGSGAQPS